MAFLLALMFLQAPQQAGPNCPAYRQSEAARHRSAIVQVAPNANPKHRCASKLFIGKCEVGKGKVHRGAWSK